MTSDHPAFQKEEVYRLITAAKQGEEAAKEQIISQNTGLVKKIALKFTIPGYELEDLMQIGYIGLLKAVERFDMSYDVMFSTYAVPMILGEIRRYLRDDGRIKISRQWKQDIRTLRQTEDQFHATHHRAPKLSELASLMETDLEHVVELLDARDAMNNMESLDDPDRSMGREAHQPSVSEESNLDLIQLKGLILDLAPKERQIIVLRYFRDRTQQEIANQLGISQVQVSRIEKKIMETLRGRMGS